MKFVATVKQVGRTLVVDAPYNINIEDGEYHLDIKSLKKMKRSDRQNSMLWALVNQICKKINGNIAESYDLYCQILEMAGAHYDDVKVKKEALDTLKALTKHVKVVSEEEENGETWCYCWIFRGISEMDTKEANLLIDTAMNYASEVGIDVDDGYWRRLLE